MPSLQTLNNLLLPRRISDAFALPDTPRAGAETVTLTYNELYRALNSPEVVAVERTNARPPRYVRNYPFREPDPLASSVNFKLREMLNMSAEPD